MRQKTFIKQTSLAILLYFICLALAVAIDLIFFKVKNMYHTPALAAIFAGWVYLGLIRKNKTIWSYYLSGYLYVPLLLCLWALCSSLSS
jgi:membrane-bound protein